MNTNRPIGPCCSPPHTRRRTARATLVYNLAFANDVLTKDVFERRRKLASDFANRFTGIPVITDIALYVIFNKVANTCFFVFVLSSSNFSNLYRSSLIKGSALKILNITASSIFSFKFLAARYNHAVCLVYRLA